MYKRYSYHEYEEAYYQQRYFQCRDIGLHLLPKIKNEKAKDLYEKLCQLGYEWDMPAEDFKKLKALLWDIKVWLMTNLTC